MNQRGIQELVKKLEEKWFIKVGEPFKSPVNFVAEAITKDGTEAVLKIILAKPDKDFLTEAQVLKTFSGEGMVKLFKEDPENNAILIERLKPGVPISELEDDEKATKIITQVMKRIWKKLPENHNFPTLSAWAGGFDWYRKNYPNGPIPKNLLEKAEAIFKNPVKNPNDQYLLHGDLHHENVLSAEREPWLAIDPKGVVGEREYETAAVLRNPYQKLSQIPNLKEVLEKRVEILSKELGLEKKRILEWGIAQTVLSVIWSLENGNKDRIKPWLRIATTLSEL